MDGDRFLELIEETGFGKKLPNAVYLHNSSLGQLHQELQSFVSVIEKAVKCEAWNVLKLSRNEFRLSFLNYPEFETDPYPSLKKSLSVDLVKLSAEERDYSDQTNPPILHRKELLVLEEHPEIENFRQITLEGENAGLYENTAIIGHKQSWEFLIKQKDMSWSTVVFFARVLLGPDHQPRKDSYISIPTVVAFYRRSQAKFAVGRLFGDGLRLWPRG